MTASSIGTLSVDFSDDAEFIPYESLTKEDVVGWLEAGLDNLDSMKENLSRQIELQKNPVEVYHTPDWE